VQPVHPLVEGAVPTVRASEGAARAQDAATDKIGRRER
jgi:hypothetical protein